MRIQQLSALVANQIAAGEVIERPASVVKELLENSLDAGADLISIEIGAGGLNQIKISDNGHGIMAEDLPLAIAAHATSKIKQLSDLSQIASMGFRGEALASIAAVSKLTVRTRAAGQPHAMMLYVEDAITSISPCARNQGTTIEVRDLFFNAPVRKRFLKTERIEYQAIEAIVKRFALSAPTIALSLKHNDKVLLTLPAVTCERTRLHRIHKLMGKAFVDASIYLDVERAGFRLQGFVSQPSYMRSQNDKQWVYLNQRMVKDKLLNHAIKQAYDAVLYPGRFPACLLYLNMLPQEVDVNVHPTKHEVRFQQPRLVHDFMTSQLRNALAEVVSIERESATTDRALQKTHKPIATCGAQVALTGSDSWKVLNRHYVVFSVKNQSYLLDLNRFQQYRMTSILQAQSFPLPSRPLLVPITYAVDKGLAVLIAQYRSVFLECGMDLNIVQTDQCYVKSIPILFPSMDIPKLLQKLAEHVQQGDCSQKEVFMLMLSTQSVDAYQLEPDEQTDLQQQAQVVLSRSDVQNDWCILLDIKACQGLFNG